MIYIDLYDMFIYVYFISESYLFAVSVNEKEYIEDSDGFGTWFI